MTEPARGVRPPAVGDSSFDEYYYAHCCGDPYERNDGLLRFFAGIADRLIADIAPRTVLDAGCAIGLLVEALRQRGVEASGIDVSSFAIGKVGESVRAFCHHGSIAEDLPQRYDLIVSIEVLEHMPVREAEAAIANFCRHTDDVLFSSSPLDYKEPTHINVHPPDYWAAEFARHGFYRDVDFDASYITPWATRFRKSGEPLHRVVRDYERRFWELLVERNDTRGYSMQVQQDLAAQLQRVAALERDYAGASAQRDAAAAERDATAAERDATAAERDAALAAARADAETAQAETHRANVAEAAAARDAAALRERDAALARTVDELAQARDRIFNMERSLFWRARRLLRR